MDRGDVRAAEKHLKLCLKLGRGATQPVQLEFLLLRVQTGELEEVAPTLIDSVDTEHTRRTGWINEGFMHDRKPP